MIGLPVQGAACVASNIVTKVARSGNASKQRLWGFVFQ
jgi:hypothetical protein